MKHIAPLAKLVENLRSLPGIGGKTASRLAYHILEMDKQKAVALAEAIVEAKNKITYCNICFNLTDTNPCKICSSELRDDSVICVVEEPRDVAAMERMREFKGLYHVLHGSISPMNGVGPDDIKIKELLEIVAKKRGEKEAGKKKKNNLGEKINIDQLIREINIENKLND